MSLTKKIIFGILILFGLFIAWVYFGLRAEEKEESKFYSIKIPENINFERPTQFLTNHQIDSLKSIDVNEEKIVVVGDGYNGYTFYMWHKPIEKGKIYIKAFELTQNVQLSEEKLNERTKNDVSQLSSEFKLYEGNSVIYEGTFSNFYPVRFELWFKPESSDKETKLTETNYVIDGWDR